MAEVFTNIFRWLNGKGCSLPSLTMGRSDRLQEQQWTLAQMSENCLLCSRDEWRPFGFGHYSWTSALEMFTDRLGENTEIYSRSTGSNPTKPLGMSRQHQVWVEERQAPLCSPHHLSPQSPSPRGFWLLKLSSCLSQGRDFSYREGRSKAQGRS